MARGILLFRVLGGSMLPTLQPGDYILARKYDALNRPLQRGDIVVGATFGQSQIKRIVGLPNEFVTLSEGTLLIDGERLVEPYLRGFPPYLGLDYSEYRLDSDEYFVLGDSRARSTDSRHYGPVKRQGIEGKAIVRIWPPQRWGKL